MTEHLTLFVAVNDKHSVFAKISDNDMLMKTRSQDRQVALIEAENGSYCVDFLMSDCGLLVVSLVCWLGTGWRCVCFF